MEMERRALPNQVTLDTDTEGNSYLEGYAIVFNEESRDLGGFTEIVSPEAVRQADFSDTVAVFNHDTNMLLGRVTSGTLTLSTDERGVKYRVKIPNTTHGNDVKELTQRGDLVGSSFAFSLAKNGDKWEERGDKVLRTITAFGKIFDVSPVTHPAYPTTDVGLRSLHSFLEGRQAPETTEPKPITDYIKQLTTIKIK
jgi:uncharacterized protein